jgi:hypothetical protein
MDAELPREVVRRRDDTASTWVSADDERLRAKFRILELLYAGVERIEIQVRDDHPNKRTGWK